MRSKHQTERIKCDLAMDTQDNRRTWQKIEVDRTVQSESLLDNTNLHNKEYEFLDITELIKQEDSSATTTFSDNVSKEQQPKTSTIMKQKESKYSNKVRYILKNSVEGNYYYKDCNNSTSDLQNNQFQSTSESSSDSEDGFCKTFESEIDSIDYEETSNEDTEDDEDIEEITKHKVKFNLIPIVHIMVQWNYAYQAARKSPWERIAQDRQRFQKRIRTISRILNPILTVQHRSRIWQERFKYCS